MGQYQRWLLYQEIDRRLRTELETLEKELAHLESQLDTAFLEQIHQNSVPLTDNPIIRILMHALGVPGTQASSLLSDIGSPGSPASPISHPSAIASTSASESTESISAALLSWGGLSDSGPQEIEEPAPAMDNPSTPLSHPEIALLPEDLLAFIDEHSQTEPQIELPWWLRGITIGTRPIDQESMRTNRLVQRWIERWGRRGEQGAAPSSSPKPTAESEDNHHE